MPILIAVLIEKILLVQGSHHNVFRLPTTDDPVINENFGTYAFGSFINSDILNACVDWSSPHYEDAIEIASSCFVEIEFCTENIELTNTSSEDLNYIYLSYNLNGTSNFERSRLHLDDITLTIDEESYPQPQVYASGCQVDSILVSAYASSFWVQTADGLITVDMPQVTPVNVVRDGHKMLLYNFGSTFKPGCNDFTLMQECPPCYSFEAPFSIDALCCQSVFEWTCPEEVSGYDSYFIDASLPGMHRLSDWVEPNGTIPNQGSNPNSVVLEDIRIVINGDLAIDYNSLEVIDCLVEFEQNSG